MILNPGEAILWEDADEARECLRTLDKAGFKTRIDRSLLECDWEKARGVRCVRRCAFPSCIAIVDQFLADSLLADGTVPKRLYGDRGEKYDVRWWHEPVIAVVEDLL